MSTNVTRTLAETMCASPLYILIHCLINGIMILARQQVYPQKWCQETSNGLKHAHSFCRDHVGLPTHRSTFISHSTVHIPASNHDSTIHVLCIKTWNGKDLTIVLVPGNSKWAEMWPNLLLWPCVHPPMANMMPQSTITHTDPGKNKWP